MKLKIHKRKTHLGAVIYVYCVCMYLGCGVVVCAAKFWKVKTRIKRAFPIKPVLVQR